MPSHGNFPRQLAVAMLSESKFHSEPDILECHILYYIWVRNKNRKSWPKILSVMNI